MDNNCGHSRMSASQDGDFVKTNSLKASIDQVCRTKTYTATPLKAVPEVSKEDDTDNDEDILGHSPTGVLDQSHYPMSKFKGRHCHTCWMRPWQEELNL